MSRVAVIGGGYAGLAAAVELADSGIAVDVFEASRTLGGRARAVELDGLIVDNGAHILVGAYRETLKLMEKVGAGETALKRQPLRLEFPGHMKLVAPRLPAPLHLAWALLSAEGLTFSEKFAAIRFMRALKKARFRLPRDITARQLIANQPPRLRRFLWEPLCLAALNTPVSIASAQVFLNVLRDSLAADRAASDLLLPVTDFSQLFPEPAARYIAAHGGQVIRATRIGQLKKVGVTEGNPFGTGWTAHAKESHGPYDQLVLATAPYHLPLLIAAHPEFNTLCGLLGGVQWQPIATAYLSYPASVRLPFAMSGVDGRYAQWLFDRGALCGQHGLIAAVISGAGPWQALSHAELALAIHAEIARILPGLAPPKQHWVIEDKRATFACTPDLVRPATATACPNVWLAGDFVAGDYPATLEGAVRSGVAAARAVLAARSATKQSPSTAPVP